MSCAGSTSPFDLGLRWDQFGLEPEHNHHQQLESSRRADAEGASSSQTCLGINVWIECTGDLFFNAAVVCLVPPPVLAHHAWVRCDNITITPSAATSTNLQEHILALLYCADPGRKLHLLRHWRDDQAATLDLDCCGDIERAIKATATATRRGAQWV